MPAQNSYRWVIVAIGALMTCIAIGAMFSLAIFLQPMADATGWSRAGISTAMTLNFLVMGASGFGWGFVSDRFGARPVVLAGSVLLGLALVLASRSTTLLSFQLIYGICRRARRRRFLCADDRCRDRLVRDATRPRRVARLGRHGRRAGDRFTLRGLAAPPI